MKRVFKIISMKYKISFLLLVLVINSGMAAVSLSGLIRMCPLSSHNWKWLINDSILNNSYFQDFPIHAIDTVFIIGYHSDGLSNIILWNNQQQIKFSEIGSMKVQEFQPDWYSDLLYAWNIDSLRKLSGNVGPKQLHYVHRFILLGNLVKVDTLILNRPIMMPNIIKGKYVKENPSKVKDSLFNDIKLNNTPISDDSTNNKTNIETASQHEISKSIWQRIIDWFRNLWKSIFG